MGSAWQGHRNKLNEKGEVVDRFDLNSVFIQVKDGKHVNLSTPGHKFHEIIDWYNGTVKDEAMKLPHIRLHDLRHTGATLLIANHTDIETVSRRLGHSNASVTLDIYGHALPENDRKAAVAMGKLLGSDEKDGDQAVGG